uniref:Endosulphine n=2 Tax=Oryza brachyantha TaxID=4533 RepID=J3L2M7_ORYBR
MAFLRKGKAEKMPGNRPLKFIMSGMPTDDATGQVRMEGDVSDKKEEKTQDQNEESGMPSPQEEEAAIKKKYGGILPKRTPHITKDHERAYFDSADWALGKQGGSHKPKGPLEALRPKLQPTHARARRTPYASADNDECMNLPSEDVNQNGDPVEDKNKEEV